MQLNPDKFSIGLFGFEPHLWQSVERTRLFYQCALTELFELRYPDKSTSSFDNLPDALLNFSDGLGWRLRPHPACPLIFAMHGGVILNQAFLFANLDRLETTDLLIVNCTSDLKILRAMFTGPTPQLCYLPLPVDSKIFRPLGRGASRQRLPIKQVDFIVGFVARLLPQKNLHQFLYMLAELKRKLAPQSVLGIIIGQYWIDYPVLNYTTEYYPQTIASLLGQLDLIQDVAYFPTVTDDEEMAVLYSAMDLLIHPTHSIDENFGYAPLEAMACGTPVLGTAYGGLKDTVISNQTGFLMPTWVTPTGLRTDLITGLEQALAILTNPEIHKQMSLAAVHRAKQNYSFRACADRLNSAIQETITGKRHQHTAPLQVKVQEPTPPLSGLLPQLNRPWEDYQQVVREYASTRCPRLHSECRVRLPAALEQVGPNAYRLEDPAWPATFQLTSVDWAVLQNCQLPVAAAELQRDTGVTNEQLNHWIQLGLLISTIRQEHWYA